MENELEGRGILIRRAAGTDADVVVANSLEFNIEDGHPFSPAAVAAMLRLLEPECQDGLILLLLVDGEICGHGVLCFGYGTEHGGRDTFIEEIYIMPRLRAQGFGRILMQALEDAARDAGCTAIHLEVMPNNRAERLYRRLGYDDRGSLLLSKQV